MSNPPKPLRVEDAPEIPDTFVSFVAGCGIDSGVVMVTLAADRLTVGEEPQPFRRVCARLVILESVARDLANTLQEALATAESFRTQSSAPN